MNLAAADRGLAERGLAPIRVHLRWADAAEKWQKTQAGRVCGGWDDLRANAIGIVLGGAAALAVVDLDPRNGYTGSPLDWSATVTAETVSGGWHLYFRCPPAALYWAARQAGALVDAGLISRDVADGELFRAVAAWQLPETDMERRRVAGTIRDGVEKGGSL